MIPNFRAWDKTENKMWNVETIYIEDEWVKVNDGSIYGITKDLVRDYVLMQSTGLKDKNGVEIYEGDIIRGPYDTGIIGYEMVTTEVKYDLLKGFQLGQFDLNITEVIGNIYENPDLLEDN
ncbi:YopX family protein [Staphylococcus epidermidis]|nr:YopX family protein [Staphylococcus epidermidis]